MKDRLDRTQRRILGVLAEKQLSTPHLYPLTLNALVNGCNQKTAREPVMHLQEFEVEGSLKQLFLERWVTNSAGGGARTVKWKHRLDERLVLSDRELAVMTELLLRGPQQPGALRAHATRLLPGDLALEALQAILGELEQKELVCEVPPAPGERSRRWDHCLYPEGEASATRIFTRADLADLVDDREATQVIERPDLGGGDDRIERLERRVERLERELGLAPLEDGD